MKIKSLIKNYTVEVVDNVLNNRQDFCRDLKFNRCFYFIDRQFYNLYVDRLKAFVGSDLMLLIDADEQNKEYLKLADFFKTLIDAGFQRSDLLVTFGGGILQDISGFIASTLYRGIKWTFVPTTLLAQADSCIGSKTSINFGDSKNLIGTFYPPDMIYIDSTLCQTLNDSYFNSGVGEIIKFHLLSDQSGYKKLREYLASGDLREPKLLKAITQSTLEIKKSYFESDELDTGRRNLLNYGHCFGHALESASQFGIGHGEAVLIGMGFANLLALKRGLLSKELYQELEQLFIRRYPDFSFKKISADTIINYLKRDKKRVSKDLTMILLEDIGVSYKFDDVKESEIKDVYRIFAETYPNIEIAA